jgi:hypothetical protein
VIELLVALRTVEAGIVIAGLLVTVSFLADGRIRVSPSRWLNGAVATVLVAIAGFVWLRAIDRPASEWRTLYYAAIVTVLPAAIWMLRRLPAIAAIVEQAFLPADRRTALIITAAIVALAVPMAVIPVARFWDVSGWMDSHSYDAFAHNIALGKLPEGSSSYMPVYQYGPALVYYVVGHFFYAQQIVNVILALVAVAAVCLSAWVWFDTAASIVVAGVLAVYSTALFYAVHFTQVETWYTPIVAVLVLGWAAYLRSPSLRTAVILGLLVGLGMSTRNQGTIFFGFLALSPVMVGSLTWPVRWRHFAVIGGLTVITMVPWTVRNYQVDERISPFSSRTAMYVGILSDHRVPLYGIRYWEGWEDIAADNRTRYANPKDLERAYLRTAWSNFTRDPAYTARALVWRSVAFYGLLPDGYMEIAGIRSTDWRREWKSYVFSRSTSLLLLPLSALALFVTRSRTVRLLAGAVLASVLIGAVVSSSEERVCYPVMPMHMLMTAALFRPRSTDPEALALPALAVPWRAVMAAGAAIVLVIAGARVTLGVPFAYRPLMERSVRIDPSTSIDEQLPLLSRTTDFTIGQKIRARVMLTNYMDPPKHSGPVPEVPALASDPAGATFFFTYLISSERDRTVSGVLGVTFRDAIANELVREGDAVEIQGVILHGASAGDTLLWLAAERVIRLPIARAEMPMFQ